MERPYIICHMLKSLDGKVTGSFLGMSDCAKACEIYYDLHRSYKADGFACGRVTMNESFTKGYFPDLSKYEETKELCDYIAKGSYTFFAVSFDRFGKLGWQDSVIHDEDPGYDNAHIIEIVSEQVDKRYLTYLKEIGVSYIFAGNSENIEIEKALIKLKKHFGINTLLLEGGSITNGAFERKGLIDEISLVVPPVVAGDEGYPLFYNGKGLTLEQIEAKEYENSVEVLRYKVVK